ncbi:MAG: helix-turn-helix transcriptional regulator [Terriglobia bacterium]
MLPDEKTLLELTGSLYEAAACPERWDDFLRVAVRVFEAERAGMTVHHSRNGNSATVQNMFGISPEGIREYNEHYGARYPVLKPVLQYLRQHGSWYGLSRSVVPEEEFKKSEYYNDWGRKYGSFSTVIGAIGKPPHQVTGLSIIRSDKEPPLGEEAVELMGVLMPHLNRVLEIHDEMETLRAATAAALSALDATESAVFAVNGNGEVVLMSRKAEELLREGDGVRLCGKQLLATETPGDRQLDLMVRSAAATGAGRGFSAGGSLLLPRRARRPLQVAIVPFHSSHMLVESAPCALVFITDPDARIDPRTAVLSALYRLTPAECRLADLLLQGLELAAAAESLRITTGSARFMLKNVFHKTETHRQAELIRLLLRLPKSPAQP